MYLIGIAGGSGSGKTTFAKKVLSKVNEKISLLHMDSYYRPAPPESARTKKGAPNFDHPDAFDWDLLLHHLYLLKDGHDIKSPVYDFTKNTRTDRTTLIKASKVVIFEGIFSLFNQDVRDLLDITCYLNVEADIRFSRRLHRDVHTRGRSLQSVLEQYYETVRPMHQKFLAPQSEFAHLIVGEETEVAAELLAAKINDLLKSRERQVFSQKFKSESPFLNAHTLH